MSHIAARRRQLPMWAETVVLVAAALAIAMVVKTFFVQAFYIPSESMEPTMMKHDKLLVQKISYWAGTPHRGDIVVFNDPDHWLDASETRTANGPVQKGLEAVGLFPTGGHLIKRVVGVGGDTVSCCDAKGNLQVNGTSVEEPYIASIDGNHDFGVDLTPHESWSIKVAKNHIWVMGDNRGDSADSRAHIGEPGDGQVPVDDVVGQAWLRLWPSDRFGIIHHTKSFNAVKAGS